MIIEAKEQLQKDLAKLKAKQDGDGKIMERIDGFERDLRQAKELNDKLESESKTFASENKVLVFFNNFKPLSFNLYLFPSAFAPEIPKRTGTYRARQRGSDK